MTTASARGAGLPNEVKGGDCGLLWSHTTNSGMGPTEFPDEKGTGMNFVSLGGILGKDSIEPHIWGICLNNELELDQASIKQAMRRTMTGAHKMQLQWWTDFKSLQSPGRLELFLFRRHWLIHHYIKLLWVHHEMARGNGKFWQGIVKNTWVTRQMWPMCSYWRRPNMGWGRMNGTCGQCALDVFIHDLLLNGRGRTCGRSGGAAPERSSMAQF